MDGQGVSVEDYEKESVAQLYSMIPNGMDMKVVTMQVNIIETLREKFPKPSTDPVLEHAETILFRLIKQGADATEIKLQAESIRRLKAPLAPGKFRLRLVSARFTNVTFCSSSSKGEKQPRTCRAEES
jgi:hypothetical protein